MKRISLHYPTTRQPSFLIGKCFSSINMIGDFMKTSTVKWLVTGLAAAGIPLAAAPTVTNDPYGICSHMTRWGLPKEAPRQFIRISEAGLSWVRTDFDWKFLEKKNGEWDFSSHDKVVVAAGKAGVNILPILENEIPSVTPAWKHLDAWGNFVHKVVSRYHRELRYWEVWNEPNLSSFWRDTPSGRNYTALLRRTYEEIKKIDPDLKVLYGGTSGIPLPYIEESFQAGAGEYFDIMNIHPYQQLGTPEMMIPELNDLKILMKKYHIDKPIWITEIGWSTARPPAFSREVLPNAFRQAGIIPSESTAAVVSDPKNGFPRGFNFDFDYDLSDFKTVERVTLKQLSNLDPTKHQVLVPAVGEEFPAEYIPDLVKYLRRGGTLLLPSGLPFYFDLQLDGQNAPRRIGIYSKYMADFHIGWDSWWVKDGIPKMETWQNPAPGFTGKFTDALLPSGRFLHDRNLKKGDQFIPIILAGTDNYQGVTVGLYKLNSDLKGNIIVCTPKLDTVAEIRQAEMLPRTYLIALANGVERIFWYEFRSKTKINDRESHYGIVRTNLEPKPAFNACRTLSKLCPPGSTPPELKRKGNAYLASWTRPDGVKIWALWTALQPLEVGLNITGKVSEAFNYLGEKQPIPEATHIATPAILYLVGPIQISFR